MDAEEDIRLHRRRPKRSVVLATRPGAVTPVASVLQAHAGTASVALLAWLGAIAPHATPAPDPLPSRAH